MHEHWIAMLIGYLVIAVSIYIFMHYLNGSTGHETSEEAFWIPLFWLPLLALGIVFGIPIWLSVKAEELGKQRFQVKQQKEAELKVAEIEVERILKSENL